MFNAPKRRERGILTEGILSQEYLTQISTQQEHEEYMVFLNDTDTVITEEDKLKQIKEFTSLRNRCEELEKIISMNGIRISNQAELIKKLITAITDTIEENGYLADGENCTLYRLKDVLGI